MLRGSLNLLTFIGSLDRISGVHYFQKKNLFGIANKVGRTEKKRLDREDVDSRRSVKYHVTGDRSATLVSIVPGRYLLRDSS